jgi:hypothetical protein
VSCKYKQDECFTSIKYTNNTPTEVKTYALQHQKTSTKATMENRTEGGKQVIVAGNTLEE